MKKIDIIFYDYNYGFIEGATTSIYDIFFNLSQFIEVKLNIIITEVSNRREILLNNNLSCLFKSFTTQTNYDSDVVILLYSLFKEGNEIYPSKITINTDKLIIIGTLDCYEFPFDKNIIPDHWNCKEVIFLNNPPRESTPPYYHQLSKYRVQRLSKLSLKKELHYKRSNKPHILKGDCYFENIGKLIFEHCYHNLPVFYNADDMKIKDGLYYYLKLFNIDGLKSQQIQIDKEEIEEKLFMSDDDYILELL